MFYRTGESVLAPILAHLSLNITLGAGGVRLSSVVFWWVMVGVYGVVEGLLCNRPAALQTPGRHFQNVIRHARIATCQAVEKVVEWDFGIFATGFATGDHALCFLKGCGVNTRLLHRKPIYSQAR
jgi:hypothetical protein